MGVVKRYYDCTIDDVNENFASGIKEVRCYQKGTGAIWFKCKNGNTVVFYHEQNCCEDVWLEDADGLVNGVDIFTDCDWCEVEKVQSDNYAALNKYDESYTWTFYKFRTNKGYDFMRWYGTSNGYYSEDVDIQIERQKNE